MQQTKVKRESSRLDTDGKVRLERKGTFIAWIIEVKVNQKKKRNTTQDVLMSIITKINIGMLCMQELAFWMCRLRCDTLSKWFSILWNKTTTKKHHLIESKKKKPFQFMWIRLRHRYYVFFLSMLFGQYGASHPRQ